MKKKLLGLIILGILLLVPQSFAASSATTTSTYIGNNVTLYTISWTSHTDGTFTNYTIPYVINGYVVLVQDDPGSTAPTALYDIDLVSSTTGASILGCTAAISTCTDGSMVNRSATISGQGAPLVNTLPYPRYVSGSLVLQIANNSVNSATGTIYITVQR